MLESALPRTLVLLRTHAVALAVAWGGALLVTWLLGMLLGALGFLPDLIVSALTFGGALGILAISITMVTRLIYFGDDLRSCFDSATEVLPRVAFAWIPVTLFSILGSATSTGLMIPFIVVSGTAGLFIAVDLAVDGTNDGVQPTLRILKTGGPPLLWTLLMVGLLAAAITSTLIGIPVLGLVMPTLAGAAMLCVAIACHEELDAETLAWERAQRALEREEEQKAAGAAKAAVTSDATPRVPGGEFAAQLAPQEVGGTWVQMPSDGVLELTLQWTGAATCSLNIASQEGAWLSLEPSYAPGSTTVLAQVAAGWFYAHVASSDATEPIDYRLDWMVPAEPQLSAAAQQALLLEQQQQQKQQELLAQYEEQQRLAAAEAEAAAAAQAAQVQANAQAFDPAAAAAAAAAATAAAGAAAAPVAATNVVQMPVHAVPAPQQPTPLQQQDLQYGLDPTSGQNFGAA